MTRASLAAAALGALSLSLALSLAPATSHAFRPDYDGERGVEVHVVLGGGTLFNTSERLFQMPSETTGTMGPRNAIRGGFDLRIGAGYRFMPLVSAGFHADVLFVSSDPVQSGTLSVPATASAATIGVYARFYPMALVNGTLEQRRVIMDRWTDPRRFDPWVSLGFDFLQTISRTAEEGNVTMNYARWTRSSVGVPVGVGFGYRVLPPLAVGISATITPWIGGGVEKVVRYLEQGNQRMMTTTYDSPDGVNASWSIGLDVRYTLSF